MSDPRVEEALAHLQAARWPEAAALLQAVLAERPDEPRALRLLGTMHHASGRHEEAVRLLERSDAVAPGDPDTTTNLGSAYLALGRDEDALRCFEASLAMQPGSAEARFNLAVALQGLGRLQEAAARYREILDAHPDYVDAWTNLTVLLLRAERASDAAAGAAAGLERDPHSFRLHVLRSRALRQLGDIDGAVRHLDEARRHAPDDPYVEAEGAGLLAESGRLSEALDAYRRVLARAPQLHDVRVETARLLAEMGRHREAAETLEEHVRAAPHDSYGWAMLARTRQDLGEMEAALEAAERAVETAPASSAAHTGLAAALLAGGREEEADRELLRAIELDPIAAHAPLARVHLAMRRGRWHAALDICERYLERIPAKCSMLAVKGMLLQQLGRTEEARRLVDLERLVRATEIAAPPGYADLGAFNAALAAHVRAHPSLSAERAGIATRGGRQTGNLLVEPKGPFADLERLLWEEIERYMGSLPVGEDHPFLRAPPRLAAINCWSVVLARSGHQTPHIHPVGWLSGVYYPELPAALGEGGSTEGWIEFGPAPEDFPLTVETERRQVRPRPGLLLLFPSYFYHRTVPFESDEERVSIAFDVLPGSST